MITPQFQLPLAHELIIGIVLAKGFWSTLCAVVIPPWALYLVIEKVLQAMGWLA